MAVLQEQVGKFKNPFADLTKDDLAPAGQWVSTLIDIRDEFGVQRPSYENPSVMELLDQTTFLFGFRDGAGSPHRIASRTMRISGNEKSNLFGFLTQALGARPKYGWDYCELKGRKFLLTVTHEARRDGGGTFPKIASICPLPAGLPADYRGAASGGGVAARGAGSVAAGEGGAAGNAAADMGEDEPLPF